jgi:hypothetical protein
MRITERRLRSIIRSVIRESLSSDHDKIDGRLQFYYGLGDENWIGVGSGQHGWRSVDNQRNTNLRGINLWSNFKENPENKEEISDAIKSATGKKPVFGIDPRDSYSLARKLGAGTPLFWCIHKGNIIFRSLGTVGNSQGGGFLWQTIPLEGGARRYKTDPENARIKSARDDREYKSKHGITNHPMHKPGKATNLSGNDFDLTYTDDGKKYF